MDSIVSLDIETTGLDPNHDAIIEIGAVRFTQQRVEDEWTTLIHPGRKIPPFITQLTGISDQMVLQAPAINAVLPELARFIGRSTILGHNVKFDISFFKRFKVFENNEIIDTYDLASVLLPTNPRYNLGALAQSLQILLPATHRALDDARVTRAVYLNLLKEAELLPLPILAELVRLAEQVNWGGTSTFRDVLRKRSKEISPARGRSSLIAPLFSSTNNKFTGVLQPAGEPAPLDLDEVSAILEPGGIFAHKFPQYEYRPQQVEMLRVIAQALSNGQHLLVEAGTGVGKSMAYLIPAAIWAIQNNLRVVISTNTINLQDQLVKKDIPDLIHALNFEIRAIVLKGRSNYFCPRRFENMRRRGPENPDEMRVLGKVLVWLQGSETGDRSEINLNGPIERSVWSKISAEDEACTTENCLKTTGGNCPFYRVRQAAQNAHLIIVNHALLLADVATGNRVLPEYQYIIIDEAHHLENATTDALSFQVTQGDIDWILRQLGSPAGGLIGWLLSAAQGILPPSEYAALNQMAQRATDLAFRFDNDVRVFFQSLDGFLGEQREGRPLGMYSHQERILPATRTQPAWGEVELTWDDAAHSLAPLVELLEIITKGLGEIAQSLNEEDNELYGSFANIYRKLAELNENLDSLVFNPKADQVYWAEANPNGSRLSLHAAPVHIGSLMERFLWREKTSVVLTSATLTTNGEFDYLRGRLSAAEADELALGSPFDYQTAALLYLVNDIPEPSDRNGHQRAVEQGLIQLCKATGGKALVLFTSYDQLKRTSQSITPVLAKLDITIYEQGDGASPHSLLENFRSADRAVLLGTRAFWEGVDVPGDALSVLIIVKLPFDVPSDPLIAARSETFEDPFSQYSLPEAILKFRQGFGRLIRSQFDHGVVAVLDSRILNKRYGKQFVDSLPDCTVRVGSLANLAQAAVRWLNL
jgi:DNA polymerase-3 subunit epsilon/ATP-dependent DNA helicase DinG